MADLKDIILKKQDDNVAAEPELMRLISNVPDDEKDDSWKKMQNIRVILRLRPPNTVENEYCVTSGVEDIPPKINGNTITMTQLHERRGSITIGTTPKTSTFESSLDGIFDVNTQQNEIFKASGQSLLEAALGGFNATLFAYGQTGSGKTYSTFGATEDGSGDDTSEMGIIPRAFVYLFQRLEEKCAAAIITQYFVSMQLLQIYKTDLLDLLNTDSNRKLKIKTDFESENEAVFVEGLTTMNISSAREALAIIVEGCKNRIVASHKLNAHSSRSHMLVLLKLIQIGVDGSKIISNINFGDLAGSESMNKIIDKSDKGKDEEEKRMADERRKEGISINSSLSALTRCINSLVKGKHPGYRDSPLTYLLKDSLGGNSKTTLLVCASPHIYNRSETVRTLRFARTAKNVKNKAKINQTLSVKALMKRIKELEKENSSLKKRMKRCKCGGVKVVKERESFMSVLGKKMTLNMSLNSWIGGTNENQDDNDNDDEKKENVEKNKGNKKKKKKKKIKNGGWKTVGGGLYSQSLNIIHQDEEDDDNQQDQGDDNNKEDEGEETEEVVPQSKSCWSYIFSDPED